MSYLLVIQCFICINFIDSTDINPLNLVVKLTGGAKDAHSSKAGYYILGPDIVNGKPHWLQDPGTNAIWYDGKSHWIIALHWNLGTDKAWIVSPDNVAGPQEATKWQYYNDKWIKSNDIIVEGQKPTYSQAVPCKKIRIRKEVNDLTQDETKVLTKAFKKAITNKTKGKKLEDIASYHGAPYKVCDGIWVYGNKWKTPSGCCPHDPQQPLIDFIIWHRLYVGMH